MQDRQSAAWLLPLPAAPEIHEENKAAEALETVWEQDGTKIAKAYAPRLATRSWYP
ncbi:MAG: hypothetical protein ACLSH1_03205 [Clostridia bacterium]